MEALRKKLQSDIATYYHTPGSIQHAALDYLSAATNEEIDIVDPSSPFMFLLEASAVNTHAAILKHNALARKMYPLLANEYDDLYHHMSDVDYLDRFAAPSRTLITLVIPVSEIIKHGIVESLSDSQRLVIPKDTQFVVGGIVWYTHVPVEIYRYTSGSLQVKYDTTYQTELFDPSTATLTYRSVIDADGEKLVIQLPVEQIEVSSTTYPINTATGLNVLIPFNQYYYYIRAYHRVSGGEWTPIKTTHSRLINDKNTPTVRLTVGENSVRVQLPEIYLTNGRIGDTVRIDLHTTRGPLTVDLADYRSSDFSGKWLDIDNPKNTYIKPLAAITNILVFAVDPVTGGRLPLSFDALRHRVIYRNNDRRTPVTYEELSMTLSDLGYALNKIKDTITERQYTCSRMLPRPTDVSVIESIGVRRSSVVIDPHQSGYTHAIRSFGNRHTLMDRALFIGENDGVRLMADVDVQLLNRQTNEGIVKSLNSSRVYRIPFTYVMDSASGMYVTRIYHLTAPSYVTRSFVAINPYLPYAINTQRVTITRDGDVYLLILDAIRMVNQKGLNAQLVYTDVNGRVSYLNGVSTEVSKTEFAVAFRLQNTMDITADNRIGISNLIGPYGDTSATYVDLSPTFTIYYYREDEDARQSAFDHEIQVARIPNRIVGVSKETLTLQLGEQVTHLACKTSGHIAAPTYEVISEDVPMTYTQIEYARDADGVPVWTQNESGEIVFTVAHAVGDIVKDPETEEIIYRQRAGDVRLNEYGQPIVIDPARVIWDIEPILLDAKYYYATDKAIRSYVKSIPVTLVDYIHQDIEPVSANLLARTELLLQPTATVGTVLVNFDSSVNKKIDTALEFKITYTLTAGGYSDTAYRSTLTESTRRIVSKTLETSVFSLSELIKQLKNNGGEDVVDVVVENPIGGYHVATLRPENTRFSIDSKLVLLSNGEIELLDAIAITYVKHID